MKTVTGERILVALSAAFIVGELTGQFLGLAPANIAACLYATVVMIQVVLAREARR